MDQLPARLQLNSKFANYSRLLNDNAHLDVISSGRHLCASSSVLGDVVRNRNRYRGNQSCRKVDMYFDVKFLVRSLGHFILINVPSCPVSD